MFEKSSAVSAKYNISFKAGEYIAMMEHISRWVGEEPLVGDDYDGPSSDAYKVQLRAVKRAAVASMMEQMVNVYANDKDCICEVKRADCRCFTVENNRVPNRVSETNLMTARLYFGSTSSGVDKRRNMRMLHTRTLWNNTSDPMIMRNAALLKLKTANWASEADAALLKLSRLLKLDVVPVQSEEQTDLFQDSDDEADLADRIDDVQVDSQRQFSRTQPYNVNQGSVESELSKFLNLPGDHFVKCK